jgi:hypothetical protein
LRENPVQLNTAEIEQGSYPKIRAFFEEARTKLQDSTQTDREVQTQEVEEILAALDRGDTRPAQERLLSIIEANTKYLRTTRDLKDA